MTVVPEQEEAPRHDGPQPSGRHRRDREERGSYREVFAIAEFRVLWIAQVLSAAGDQFAQVAIAILVYDQTRSPLATAAAYALSYLPPILGGPLLAGLADLFPRRRVMLVCDLIRVVTVGAMALPGMPLGALCVLLFATVLIAAPFSSARTALLPDVLPGDKFVIGSAVGNITFQASQILGFVAGAAVVATLGPQRTLAVDALSFCVSALLIATGVRSRPAPRLDEGRRPSLWSVSADGLRTVFGTPLLRNLLLFGWLSGFTIVPEGVAAPYASMLHGHTVTVGLLMAAIPVGAVIGAYLLSKLAGPSGRIRVMGWLAMLSCGPLIVSVWNPPLPVVLAMLVLAGAGSAYQLAAAAAFVQAVRPEQRARAFGVAQSGMYAVQGLGILIGGALAQALSPALAVGLAGMLGLTAATMLALRWTRLRGTFTTAQRSSD